MNYLIPANSKKSALIFGLFTKTDLIILGTGLGTSLLMLLIIGVSNLNIALILMIPGFVAMVLVIPVPNYHNLLQFLKNIYKYFTGRKIYKWRGWWIYGGE